MNMLAAIFVVTIVSVANGLYIDALERTLTKQLTCSKYADIPSAWCVHNDWRGRDTVCQNCNGNGFSYNPAFGGKCYCCTCRGQAPEPPRQAPEPPRQAPEPPRQHPAPSGPQLGPGMPCIEGYSALPTDCTKFLQCAHGRWVQKSCAPGTAWSSALGLCDHVANVPACR